VVQPLSGPIAAQALAVYPVTFRWEAPPERGLLLGMVAAEALAAQDRLLVFGPAEFDVYRPEADDPRAGTNLVGAMAERSLPSTGFVALRAWVERREERTSRQLDGKGTVLTTAAVVWVEHLELLDGGGAGVLLELSGETGRDPALAADPYDPTPELSRLHRELVARAWRALEPRLEAPPLPPLPVEVRWLPAAALTWAPPGAPPAAGRPAALDAVEADLRRLALYGFMDPAASDAELARRQRLPAGLLVERVEAPWAGTLRPGDVIVDAGGERAAGAQALRRVVAQARARGRVVVLSVVRSGARLALTVAPP
jgi:hypothetical protein